MIGNLAVLLAAIGVFGTNAAWPDIAVASMMAVLGLSAARDIIGRACWEVRNLTTSLS
jgi:Co/Zn/Cd efflux system component